MNENALKLQASSGLFESIVDVSLNWALLKFKEKLGEWADEEFLTERDTINFEKKIPKLVLNLVSKTIENNSAEIFDILMGNHDDVDESIVNSEHENATNVNVDVDEIDFDEIDD